MSLERWCIWIRCFLDGSLSPPFSPLCAIFSPLYSLLSFSYLWFFSFPHNFKFSPLVPSVSWYFSHESRSLFESKYSKESREYMVEYYYTLPLLLTDNIHISTHFNLILVDTLIMAANAPNNSPPPSWSGDLNLPEEFSLAKELLLISQLKQTDEFINEDGGTHILFLVSFNSRLLWLKCIKFSANYNPDIDLNLLVRHIFPPNQWWANCTLLLDALRDFSKLLGLELSQAGDMM